jgi:hypothetical protein
MTNDDANFLPIILERTRTETQYVDRDITINRAPTDESVKLLREMEERPVSRM